VSALSKRIGEEIEVLMLMKGRRTRGQLALILGLSMPSVSRRLKGDISFTIDELERIADWLDVPCSRLIDPAQSVTAGKG
jgi:transcriptional regulator with XRE-family HTH domain